MDERLYAELGRIGAQLEGINDKLNKIDKRLEKGDDRINSLEHSRTRLRTGIGVSWTLLGGVIVTWATSIFGGLRNG